MLEGKRCLLADRDTVGRKRPLHAADIHLAGRVLIVSECREDLLGVAPARIEEVCSRGMGDGPYDLFHGICEGLRLVIERIVQVEEHGIALACSLLSHCVSSCSMVSKL